MKGQIFVVDLMFALVIIVLAIGITTQAFDYHLQQTASTVEHAKMQQLAIDAAAVTYYKGAASYYWGLEEKIGPFCGAQGGAVSIGYTLEESPVAGNTCVGSTRGTGDNKVEVFVCRRE
ncbi:hypothetical protein ACFLQ2_02295 [archaeon]